MAGSVLAEPWVLPRVAAAGGSFPRFEPGSGGGGLLGLPRLGVGVLRPLIWPGREGRWQWPPAYLAPPRHLALPLVGREEEPVGAPAPLSLSFAV